MEKLVEKLKNHKIEMEIVRIFIYTALLIGGYFLYINNPNTNFRTIMIIALLALIPLEVVRTKTLGQEVTNYTYKKFKPLYIMLFLVMVLIPFKQVNPETNPLMAYIIRNSVFVGFIIIITTNSLYLVMNGIPVDDTKKEKNKKGKK